LAMSNFVAVMNKGTIEQIGKPRDVYQRPVSRFVADFIGTSNFIEGTVQMKGPDGYYRVGTSEGIIRAHSDEDFPDGAFVVVTIRPENVDVIPEPLTAAAPNRWGGKVVARAFLGESVDHVVGVGKLEIRARTNSSISIRPDTEVTICMNEHACSLIMNA
jgi:iron(III) transport system ATP-binding protein